MTENGPPEQQEPEARGWGRGDVLAGAAVTLLAGTLRFVRLGDPGNARIRRDVLRSRWLLIRQDGVPRALRRALAEEGPTMFGWLVIVPLLTYMLTFAGRLEGSFIQAPWSEASWWRAWWDRQHYMFSTSRSLSSSHPYQSPPWSWPLLKRAVSYYFETPNDRYAEILRTGNPFVWWTSILALIPIAIRWVRERGARVRGPQGFILAAVAWAYLPWFVVAGGTSAVFLFYFLPVLSFLFLGPAYLASRIGASWEARATIGLYAASAVAALAFLYPVLTKVPLDKDAWRARIWLFDDCDKAAGAPTTTTVTEIEGEETNVRTSVVRGRRLASSGKGGAGSSPAGSSDSLPPGDAGSNPAGSRGPRCRRSASSCAGSPGAAPPSRTRSRAGS